MTSRRSLFKQVAAAFVGSVIAKLPLAGAVQPEEFVPVTSDRMPLWGTEEYDYWLLGGQIRMEEISANWKNVAEKMAETIDDIFMKVIDEELQSMSNRK